MLNCPHCDARISRALHSGDFLHDCSSDPKAIDIAKNDDIVVIGNATDYEGTYETKPGEVFLAGNANELQGTRAWVEGESFEELTKRGKRKATHRQRGHIEHIE